MFVKYSRAGIYAFTSNANVFMLLMLTVLLTIYLFRVLHAAVRVWKEQRSHLKLLNRARIGLHAAVVLAADESARGATGNISGNVFASPRSVRSPSSLHKMDGNSSDASHLLKSSLVDHILEDITNYDEAPTVLTMKIKPDLFYVVQGYLVSAVAAIIANTAAAHSSEDST